MRRTLIATVVTVVSLALAAPASAHFLTMTRADGRAKIEARDFASDGEWYGWDCNRRLSAHKVRCVIASYDEESDVGCDAYVNVRFRDRRTRGTAAGLWYQIDCYSGDPHCLSPTCGMSSSARGGRLEKARR